MADKADRWTDPNTGIQVWTNSDSTKFWLKRPNVKKPYEHSNAEALKAHYKSLIKPEKFTVQGEITDGAVKTFDTEKQADKFIKIQTAKLEKEKNKPKKPKAPTEFERSKARVLSQDFDSGIQARSDSSIVFKKGGGDQYEPAGDKKKREKKEVATLRSRRQKLVTDIMKSEMQITLPQNSDKKDIMQADIDAWYSELEEVSANLGEPYQRPSVDTDADEGGGLWSGIKNVASSVGDFFTPSEEDTFKAQFRDKLQRKIVNRDVAIPNTWKSNPSKWVAIEADKAWQAKQAEIPLEQQTDAELIKGAGTE